MKLPDKLQSIEDYVRTLYPAPLDDKFYQSWGYEQWLIKTLGKSLDQLCILLQPDYVAMLGTIAIFGSLEQAYKFSSMIADTTISQEQKLEIYRTEILPLWIANLQGAKIYKTVDIVRAPYLAILTRDLPVDTAVVLLAEFNDTVLIRAWGKDYQTTLDKLQYTGEVITEQTLDEINAKMARLSDFSRVSGHYEMKHNYCNIPYIGNVYVTNVWSGDIARTYFPIEYQIAIEKKAGGYKKVAGKTSVSLTYNQIINSRLLEIK